MEELFKELSKFARENRKALEQAEQWLNEFDGNIEDAWKKAKKESPRDWTKIVFIAWLASDEKIYECEFIDKDFDVCQWCPANKDGPNPQRDFLHDVILRVGYSTDEGEDNLLIIQIDLTARGKAAAGISDTPKIALDDFKHPVKCTVVAEIVRGMSHNIAAKLKRHQYPVVKVARKNYCEVEHAAILYPKKRKALEKYKKNAEE